MHDQDIVTSGEEEGRGWRRSPAGRPALACLARSPRAAVIVRGVLQLLALGHDAVDVVQQNHNSSLLYSHTMAFDLGTPVNTALLLYILYSIQRIIFPSNSVPHSVPNEFKNGYTWMPKSHPPTLLYQTYTPKTLAPFNGQDGKRILLAIKGVVYDVTAGRNFYGPGECYGSRCGRRHLN